MTKKILSILLLLFLASCTTVKYIEKEIPIESIKTEYVSNIRHDSIYIHDSINMYIKGDTIFKDKIKICYKSIIQRDTIHIIDSIPYIIKTTETKIKEVNKLTWYQKVLNIIGLVSLIFVFTYGYFNIRK